MPNVSPEQADTYKCFATNEFGKASVTVILNVIEGTFHSQHSNSSPQTFVMCVIFCLVGFKKDKANQESSEY